MMQGWESQLHCRNVNLKGFEHLSCQEFSQSSCHWWQICLLTCLARFLKLCISVKQFRNCPCVTWCTWCTNYSAVQEKYFPTVLPTSFPTSNKKSNLRISQLSVYSSSEDSLSTMPQFVRFFFFTFHFCFLHHSDRNLFTHVMFLSCNTLVLNTDTCQFLSSKIYICLKVCPCSKN